MSKDPKSCKTAVTAVTAATNSKYTNYEFCLHYIYSENVKKKVHKKGKKHNIVYCTSNVIKRIKQGNCMLQQKLSV